MEATEAPMEAAWVPMIRQLYDHLQNNDAKINLLRRIDRMMVDVSLTLEQFVSSALENLPQVSSATEVHFYVDSGDELPLLHTTRSRGVAKCLEASVLSSILPFNYEEREPKVVNKSEFDHMEEFFPESDSLLLIPMWLSASKRFGVVILETEYPAQLSPFRDKAVRSFAQMVVVQLVNGIQFRLNESRSEWLRDIDASFFELDLEPDRCFMLLAEKIPSFLPSFGPFRMESDPEVQVLTHHADGKYLTIVGTTERETGTKVKVEDSVVGLLFEDPYPPYILGDPRNDPVLKDHYKAYLGKEEQKEIKTELAVPVEESDGRRIAVVNLESEYVNAFTKVHVEAVMDLCGVLAPLITALHNRVVEAERRQQAVMYAQRSYWNTVGALLRHNTRGHLLAIRFSIDNAKSAVNPDQAEEIEQILAPVYDGIHAVNREIEEFSKELYSYTVYGAYSIGSLISRTITRFEQRLEGSRVGIDFLESEDFEVFCSPALEMHLYNIIDNSIYWVEQRVAEEPGHQGRVSITVKPGPMPAENQEQELNRTCEVVIQDNGPGCPKETLDKLCYQPVTSLRTGEEGMGHALYAAGNYLRALGGSVKPDSKEGKWFQVSISLPIFDQRIHPVRGLGEI